MARVDGTAPTAKTPAARGSGSEVAIAPDSDAGEQLDTQARAEYETRLADLRPDLEEAEANNDLGRVEALRAEIDFLAQELARAFGLGGRERRAGSSAERARINVTRAIRSVVKKVGEENPELGRLLETTVSTGLFCSYRTDPRFPVRWEL